MKGHVGLLCYDLEPVVKYINFTYFHRSHIIELSYFVLLTNYYKIIHNYSIQTNSQLQWYYMRLFTIIIIIFTIEIIAKYNFNRVINIISVFEPS